MDSMGVEQTVRCETWVEGVSLGVCLDGPIMFPAPPFFLSAPW